MSSADNTATWVLVGLYATLGACHAYLLYVQLQLSPVFAPSIGLSCLCLAAIVPTCLFLAQDLR